MCRTIKILLSNWPWTRFSELLQAGKRFWRFSPSSKVGQDLPTILCSDWSKFDKWVHAENLCSILKLGNFDSWSWQSFVSNWDVFSFSTGCTKWNTAAITLLGFWLTNVPLVKVGNPISDSIIFVFHVAWCATGLKGLKRFWPYLIAFRSSIRNGKPE